MHPRHARPGASCFLTSLLVVATAACGDERASPCGDEGSIGPGTGASTIAGIAVAPDGALVTVTNLVIFDLDLGGVPIVSSNIVRHGPLGFVQSIGGMHTQGPYVDALGRVWVLADTLRGFTAAGIALPPIPATTFVAVSQDGTLITGGPGVGDTYASPELVRWTVQGEAVARATIVSPGHLVRDVAIGSDGTVYAIEGPPPPGGQGYRLHALTPGFDTKWTRDLVGEAATADVAVTPGGGVVVGLGDHLVALDAEGAARWTFVDASFAIGELAIGLDGSVYTLGGAVSAEGALRWRGGAPITVAADGTLYGLGEDGVVTLDPATGAIDKILSHAKYSDGWGVQPTFADDGSGCVYTGALASLDGIFVDPILLEGSKATDAGIAAPWGIPGGNAGRTSAAPIVPSVPRTVADLYGFWTRDDGDDRLTLELAATIAGAPAGPAYRVWRSVPYRAGEVVQVGGAALAGGRLTLTRAAGDGPGSTSELSAAPWYELTLVDPLTGARATFQRGYRVARPSRPSPTVDNAYATDTQSDGFQTLGGERAVAAFADPADLAFWLVQSIAQRGDEIEVHRLDPRTESAETARVAVPVGSGAPEILAGHVDEAGRLVLLADTGDLVIVPRDPTSPATVTDGDDHWWHLGPWADALESDDVAVSARAIDAAGDITIVGTFDGVLDLGDGVRLERVVVEPGRDLFVARLGADGAARWARGFPMTAPGGPRLDAAYDALIRLAVFDDGELAIAGRFDHPGPVRDNPQTAAGALELGLGPLVDTVPLDASGPGDGFLVRLDADGRPLGQLLMPARELRGLAADPSGLLVATGADRGAATTQGVVAVYDRCARELTWGVPPCDLCFGRPRLRDLTGTDVARAPDGRLMVAAETISDHVGAAVFVAALVPAGDTVPRPTCPAGTPPRVTLDVALAGDGAGRVVSEPPGIDCPGACAASFDVLTHVTLSATAAADAWHAGWSGCVGDGGACRWQARTDTVVSARFERPARRVLTTLPEGVLGPAALWFGSGAASTGTHVARADGSLLMLVSAATSIDLGGGVTVAGGAPGVWLALEPDGAPRWARALDGDARLTGNVRVAVAHDGDIVLHAPDWRGDTLQRWTAGGAPAAPWTIDFGDVQQPVVIALAATDDGALVVTRSLGGTNGIITWPETDGVVTRYDAAGEPTPIALPGADVRAVAALEDGDVILVLVHDAPLDFLGEALPQSGTQLASALARLGPAGELRWVRPLEVAAWPHPPQATSVSAGGIALMYPVTVLALGLDGVERWRAPQTSNMERLVIGADGAVTVGTADGFGGPHITRYAPDGTPAWDVRMRGPFDVDPAGRTLLVDADPPLAFIVLDP